MSQSFLATLPFSVLAVKPRFGPSGCWMVGPRDQIVSEKSHEKLILPLFTDSDLAERYSEARGGGAEPVFIDDAQAALDTVGVVMALHKITHVAFDPVFGRRVRNMEPSAAFRGLLRRSIQQQPPE